jgi:hypothetical protein
VCVKRLAPLPIRRALAAADAPTLPSSHDYR